MLVRSTLLGAALCLATAAAAHASTWTLDGSHADVGFKVRHMMVSDVRGAFRKLSGKLDLDEKDVAKSKLEVEIETGSIDTNDEARDKHLRAPDFFDADKHPKLTFRSTRVEKAADGKLRITGDLTIRGVTKPVQLEVTGSTAPVTDPWGKQRLGFAATGKINRTEFSMTWNKSLDKGGLVIGNDVVLDLAAEFVKVQETAQAK